MQLDLSQLREMHPRLGSELAMILVVRAALGLERNGHEPGVAIALDVDRITNSGRLSWQTADLTKIDQHDSNRITEDGAEAIALVLAHRGRGWRVVRRLQKEEHADWLLEQTEEERRQVIALEVSGVDRGSIKGRLRVKLAQVAKSFDVDQRWAGVVGFEQPTAALRSTEASDRGH